MSFKTLRNKYLIANVFLIIICNLFYISKGLAVEGKIIVKVENEIITNLDINNEEIYLKILNPNLTNIDKQSLYMIAKNSLIREKIKIAEISKHKLNEVDDKYLENVVNSIYSKIGIKNKQDFISYIESYGLNLSTLKEKLTYEALWNQLIYRKYFTKVKIDTDKVKQDILISNNNKTKSYLLSEIVYSVDKKDQRKIIEKKIDESIKNNGFENTASIFSISESSKTGGKLGWIDESSINTEIKEKIINLNIGEITSPIVVPGGFLILKIENIKEIENKIDINTELEKRIVFLQNTQLNQFSNIYFMKIKKDFFIDEK